MKMIKTIVIILVISLISFFLGTAYNNQEQTIVTEETEKIEYEMIGYYINEDKDYHSEASEINSKHNTRMSTSKIKHLLIYVDGVAKEYDVNYNLIKAVIATESSWNVKARSRANALGLMQIMKACATDYNTPHSEMYNPYVNVTVGTMYLSKLLKEFPDVQSALVAYNEGPRHAKKYKNEYIYTSKYVSKVTSHLIDLETIFIAENVGVFDGQ